MPALKLKFRNWTLLFSLLSAILSAQAPELGLCEQSVEELAANQIPKAIRAWNQKNYREVERYLEKAIRYDSKSADALYLLGELKLRQRQIGKAQFLWSKLLEICPNYKPEISYFLGVMYLEDNKLDKAIPLIENFLANDERDFGYDKEAQAALAEAKKKQSLFSNQVDFDPRPVKKVSTEADEYLATISPDQESLYFTRRVRKRDLKSGPAAVTRMVEEFCLAQRTDNGEFDRGAPLPSPFNTSFNEGGPSITAYNTELYFTVCEDIDGYKNCDIYYSERDEFGYWIIPRSVGDHINHIDSWESQVSVTANGDWLYFTSDRKGGLGGLDIYRCKRKGDGSWSAPQNLGPQINTAYDEKSPFIHSDSQTLYFTSKGHPGLGGFDIFYSRMVDTSWMMPENIGYPINSEDDDLGLFVSLDGKTAYFSSNTLRSNNGWDLYQFELPEQARPEEVFLLKGTLEVADGEDLAEAKVKVKNLRTQEQTEIKVDQQTGSYARVIEKKEASDFIVKVEKKGAAFSSRYLSANELDLKPAIEADLQLASMEVGREYTLNDIQFNSNSAELNKAARSIIGEFVLFMKDNTNLQADIQGHTDNVGDDQSNLKLSQNRAKAVYDYALSLGLQPSRLSWHGYGESRPIADNDDEKGRAKNRRTVFVITAR